MTVELQRKYVELHKQGWVPIFVNDRLDALTLAEICVDAGFRAIEITCRRSGICKEIRQIRERFPELLILVGSVVEESVLLPYLRTKRADFPSMEQLAELGVDGFVAQLPFSHRTLTAYASEFLMIPGVETIREAVNALNAGAHFVKFCSAPPNRMKQINSEATYRLFPIFYTGGATLESVGAYIQSGAVLLGGGWDLMLAEQYEQMQTALDPHLAAARLTAYGKAHHEARAQINSHWMRDMRAEPAEYLSRLSHFHPFAG